MPELPEVETVRRGLEKLILGKKISSVEIRYPKMIKTDLDEFQKKVPGQIVESMGRRGKYLIFYLTDKVLISHLRMEGKYFYIRTRFLNENMPMFSFSLKMVARLFMRMFASLVLWNFWLLTFWKSTLFLKN
ncbi:Formamidopyrimidine-DNA glycosylase [Streptococcus mitis]|nr:Formamidopyrimidine-DNA glycosylase [Streptococcus mitis]